LVKTMTWATTSPADTILGNVPVSPFYCRGTDASGYKLTAGGFVALPFQYWRGDMEYFIIVPVSKFHRGTLQIYWSTVAVPATTDATNSMFNTILDVTSGSSKTLTVGFAKETPVLDSFIFTDTFPLIIPIGTCANGILTFRVANPLQAPMVAASTTILVFARVKSNFTFGVPKTLDIVYNTDSTTSQIMDFSRIYRVQAGALGDEVSANQSIVVVPDSAPYPVDTMLFGEKFGSIRAFIQKFSEWDLFATLIQNWPSPLDPLYVNHFCTPPCSFQQEAFAFGVTTGVNDHMFSWGGWYASMYVGIAGGTRYKMVNTSNVPIIVSISHQSFPRVQIISPVVVTNATTAPAWCIQPGEAVEVTVPYYANVKFYPVRGIPGIQGATTYTWRIDRIQMTALGTATNTVFPKIYQACAPDTRLVQFRFIPKVVRIPQPS